MRSTPQTLSPLRNIPFTVPYGVPTCGRTLGRPTFPALPALLPDFALLGEGSRYAELARRFTK